MFKLSASLSMIAITLAAMNSSAIGNGTYLGANLLYDTKKVTQSVGGSESTGELKKTSFDLDLGYATTSGLYLGGVYNSTTNDDAITAEGQTAYGVSIGYMSGPWVLMAKYFLSAKIANYNVANDEWGSGSGLGLSAGYLFPVSSWVAVGGSLNYRSIKYTKYTINGADQGTRSLQVDEIYPRLTLGFMF